MIMQYRKDKNGNEISVLGYGCMRFTKEGGHADIDKAEKEVMAAIDAGVNYLDTAYVYAGNEAAVGEILARNHCRERIYLATKLPHYLIKSVEGAQKMFEEELRRLQTDYIDYYLMHMLTDLPTWEKLKKLGMEDWIREKKASGEIRNIGFSYHGRSDMFMQLIDAYDWDFCQIQYNYMDEHSQAGVEGLRYAHARGIPVIIMEPLRGGRLAKATDAVTAKLQEMRPDESVPAWAFRFLQAIPGVTMVLSGMSDLGQLKANVSTWQTDSPLDKAEFDMLIELADEETRKGGLPCTACHYCTSHCPQNLPIPDLIALYNEHKITGGGFIAPMAVASMPKEQHPSNCIGCQSCETVCPQRIKISEMMADFTEMLKG